MTAKLPVSRRSRSLRTVVAAAVCAVALSLGTACDSDADDGKTPAKPTTPQPPTQQPEPKA